MTSATLIRPRAYVLPQPCDSEAGYRRFYHLDLNHLSALQLWAENEAAAAALAAIMRGGADPVIVYENGRTLSASWWLRERIERTQGGRP